MHQKQYVKKLRMSDKWQNQLTLDFFFFRVGDQGRGMLVQVIRNHFEASQSFFFQASKATHLLPSVQRIFFFLKAAILFSLRSWEVGGTEFKFSNHKTSCRCIRTSNLEWIQVLEVEDHP